MKDFFPINSYSYFHAGLAYAIEPFCKKVSFNTLALHVHEVLLVALFYNVVCYQLSPYISKKLFPIRYNALSARTRFSWNVHSVSFVQSLIVCAAAIYDMLHDKQRQLMGESDRWPERLWGYTGGLGLVQALGCGYFVWDFFITLFNIQMFGVSMLIHAIAAVSVFSLGFRPFLNYYAPTFLMYELSSPFLNIHWFCDKLGKTGSTVQLVNGICLILVFISCRILWGTYSSAHVIYDIYLGLTASSSEYIANRAFPSPGQDDVMKYSEYRVPLWLATVYITSNLTLNTLNFYWISKMISKLRSRFDQPIGTRTIKKIQNSFDVEISQQRTRSGFHELVDHSGFVTQKGPLESSSIRQRATMPN